MRRPLVHIVLIVALGFVVYSNTFHSPFLFDGRQQIIDNPVIRNLKNFVSDRIGYDYNPRRFVGYLSLALNYHFGGLDVAGYHLVNLLIHTGNALLVYLLVLLTFRTPHFEEVRSEGPGVMGTGSRVTIYDSRSIDTPHLIAPISALLFVSHPLQTEAVTYVVQRFASLATFFYLLSLVMYIKGRLITERMRGYGRSVTGERGEGENTGSPVLPITHYLLPITLFSLSLFSAVLAMKTKEIAFTLPLVATLYEFIFFKGPVKKRLLFLVLVLLTLMIVPLSMLHTHKPLGELLSDLSEQTRIQTQMSRWEYLVTEMRVIVTYIRLIFLPINQNLDYDYPVYHSLFKPPVLVSFLLLAAILGTGVYLLYKVRGHRSGVMGKKELYTKEKESVRGHRSGVMGRERSDSASSPITHDPLPMTPSYRLAAFGILWFFITLSVESSIIPIVDVIFEHRLYLPLVGIFIAITTGVSIAAKRLRLERIVIPTLVLIIFILSGLTYARNNLWKDDLALWQDVVAKSPDKARPHYNLGVAYVTHGRLDRATAEFQTALRLKPDYTEAHVNLGVAYKSQGLMDSAIAEYRAALRLKPDYAEAHNDLGTAYASQGRWDRAIAEYRTALQAKPDYPEAHYNLGIAYESEGRWDRATEEYQTAVRLKPDYARAHYNLGIAYESQGRRDKAIEEYQTTVRLKPDYAEAHVNLGIAYASQGQLDRAITEFRAAARLRPDFAEVHVNLGVAYASQGRWDRAIEEYRTAVRLKPDYAKAHYNLGIAYEAQGQLDRAATEYRTALQLRPDFAEARRRLNDIVSGRRHGSLMNVSR